jgi:hypothetical protein
MITGGTSRYIKSFRPAITRNLANEGCGDSPRWTQATSAGGNALDETYAVGVGGHGFHTGLMWRADDPGIEPDPRSLHSYGAKDG